MTAQEQLKQQQEANNSTKKRCYEIQTHIDNLITKYFEETKAAFKIQESKKALIMEMAQAIEERYVLKGESQFVGNTCSYIQKVFRMRGAPQSEINYIREVLPSKYRIQFPIQHISNAAIKNNNVNIITATTDEAKQHTPTAIEQSTSQNVVSADKIEECSNYIQYVKDLATQVNSVNLDLLGHSANQFWNEAMTNNTNRSHKYCNTHNIATWDEHDQGYGDRSDFAGIPDRFRERIPIEKPRLPANEHLAKAWDALIEKLESAKQKTCVEYPTKPDDDISFRLAEAIYTFIEFFDPYTDDKWRRHLYDWANIIDLRFKHGKHGASSLSADIDASGKKRKITREQIGDKTPVAVNFFKRFVENVPFLFIGCEWYRKCKQPYTSRLSNMLHNKLSEKS